MVSASEIMLKRNGSGKTCLLWLDVFDTCYWSTCYVCLTYLLLVIVILDAYWLLNCVVKPCQLCIVTLLGWDDFYIGCGLRRFIGRKGVFGFYLNCFAYKDVCWVWCCLVTIPRCYSCVSSLAGRVCDCSSSSSPLLRLVEGF